MTSPIPWKNPQKCSAGDLIDQNRMESRSQTCCLGCVREGANFDVTRQPFSCIRVLANLPKQIEPDGRNRVIQPAGSVEFLARL